MQTTFSRKFLISLAGLSLVFSGLACKTVTRVFIPPTKTPLPPTLTPTPTVTPSPTATATPSPTPIPEFTSSGVRHCYYVPGVSQPAQMPPEVVAMPTPFIYPTITPLPQTKVSGGTIQRQLGLYRELWKAVNTNYVYTDFNGKDWKKIGARYEALIKQGLSDDDFYAAMREMIFELGDEHSAYLSPDDVEAEEARQEGDTEFVGIGIVATTNARGERIIISVYPDSPAEEAGLRSHDKITQVDGLPVYDETTGESRIQGEEGSEVTLTIHRPGEEPREVTLVRARTGGKTPVDYCIVPGTRIGYIFFPNFYESTIDEQTREALEKMTSDGPLDGLVLDNRMNGGGSNAVVEPILGYFTDGVQGHYVSRKEREEFEIFDEDINGSQEVPLVILVDSDTVSFGEIFSGILRLNGRAKIVGRNTFGNVEVLYRYKFTDGSLAWIASATFEPVGEESGIWERTGIVPDYLVPTRWDMFTEATDPALAKAVEILLGEQP